MNNRPENSVDDITAFVGEVKNVSVKGKIYKVSACSMADMPKLQKLLLEFEKIDNVKANTELMVDQKSLNLMAKIIRMGIKEHHPDIDEEKILQSFSLGAFPVIVQIIMDLNDFLLGMGALRQQGTIVEQMAEPKKKVFPRK